MTLQNGLIFSMVIFPLHRVFMVFYYDYSLDDFDGCFHYKGKYLFVNILRNSFRHSL